MAKTVPIRELRSDLANVLDEVADRREHVVVTRHGKPTAAIIPADEYEALEETAEILSDPDALESIEQGLSELNRDKVVALEELRAELETARKRAK